MPGGGVLWPGGAVALPAQQCSPLVLRGEKLAELAGRASMAPHGSLVPALHPLGSLSCGVTQASEKQGRPMASTGPGPAGQEGPIKAERGRLRGEAPRHRPRALRWPLSGEPSRCSVPAAHPRSCSWRLWCTRVPKKGNRAGAHWPRQGPWLLKHQPPLGGPLRAFLPSAGSLAPQAVRESGCSVLRPPSV